MLKDIKYPGFTIVELLIVIVVIAILAAISIVTYTGIQERAKNVAVISSVESWTKVLSLSYTMQGTIYVDLADGDNSICLGRESDYPAANGLDAGQCYAFAHTNDELMNAISSISNVTTGVHYTDEFRGLQYGYDNGSWKIWYELFGDDQDCGLPSAQLGTSAPSGLTGCMVEIEDVAGGIPVAW